MSLCAVLAWVVGCAAPRPSTTTTTTAASDPKPSPAAAAPPAAAGAPVGTEALAEPIVVETYFVLIPDLADVTAADRAARACRMPPGVDLKIENRSTEDVPSLTYLATLGGVIERDRPEVKRTRRVLALEVVGDRSALEPILRASAACARSTASAGHAWIVDFHTMQLFTLAEFDAQRGNGFVISARSLVAVHPWPEKGSKDTGMFATSGLVSFGLPELKLRNVPRTEPEMLRILSDAAETLIERGRLDRVGTLDVDLQRLTQVPWPADAKEVAEDGGTGKASFIATWLEPTQRPREIELQLPGGTREHVAEVGHAYDPPRIYRRIPPEAEAAAARARVMLRSIAPHLASMPDDELMLVKVLRPLAENSDVLMWMWLPVTSIKDGQISFFVPEHIGMWVPYGAGKSFHVAIDNIFDYVVLKDRGATVVSGGETDKFVETKPPARMKLP